MARKSSVSLPTSQGGLIGGFSVNYKTKYDFSPKFVIYFSILVVVFIFVLNNIQFLK